MQQQPEDPPRFVPPGPASGSAGVLPVSRPLNSLAIVSLVAGTVTLSDIVVTATRREPTVAAVTNVSSCRA